MIAALTLALLLCAAGMPTLLAAREDVRAEGAVDLLVDRFRQARMEALRRGAYVAIRFEMAGDDVALAVYGDTNHNGVRATDIASGTDRLLRPPERLGQQFPGVKFGFAAGVPDLDGTPSAENSNPFRLGSGRMLSFGPSGTSSSGTVYLVNRTRRQFAVRILGGTGRTRAWSYNFAARRWSPR
jgi:hypothetical protein